MVAPYGVSSRVDPCRPTRRCCVTGNRQARSGAWIGWNVPRPLDASEVYEAGSAVDARPRHRHTRSDTGQYDQRARSWCSAVGKATRADCRPHGWPLAARNLATISAAAGSASGAGARIGSRSSAGIGSERRTHRVANSGSSASQRTSASHAEGREEVQPAKKGEVLRDGSPANAAGRGATGTRSRPAARPPPAPSSAALAIPRTRSVPDLRTARTMSSLRAVAIHRACPWT